MGGPKADIFGFGEWRTAFIVDYDLGVFRCTLVAKFFGPTPPTPKSCCLGPSKGWVSGASCWHYWIWRCCTKLIGSIDHREFGCTLVAKKSILEPAIVGGLIGLSYTEIAHAGVFAVSL